MNPCEILCCYPSLISLFFALSIVYIVGEILRGPSSSVIMASYKCSEYFGYAMSAVALGGLMGAIISGGMIDMFGL
ncbi:hypothetical protein DRJ48_04835 [Candidatus Woesearchaeota archaeon]|nr:MAG: hypothetical protein DRJ48_04835 [Candidatus Woesearchaeota archaeon]